MNIKSTFCCLNKTILVFLIIVTATIVKAQVVILDDQNLAHFYGSNEQLTIEFDTSYFTCYLNTDTFNLDDIESMLDSFPSYVINGSSIDLFMDFEDSLPAFEDIIADFQLDTTDVVSITPGLKLNGLPVLLSDEVIVKTGPQITTQDLVSGVKRFDGTIVDSTDNDVYTIELDNPGSSFDIIQSLYADGLLLWGQPNFLVDICPFDLDPLYSNQFQLKNVGQSLGGAQATPGIDVNIESAWDITKGNPSISLAIFDDGVSFHPDLSGVSPLNFNGSGPENSSSYHGIGSAGIIGAQHNDIGVKGIAPYVHLYSQNIFTCGVSISSIAEAFYDVVDKNIAIINNSWGFLSTDAETGESNTICETELFPALNEAIAYAASNGRDGKGTVIVFASGNSQSDNATHCVTYPANHPDVIAVGAMTPTGDHAS